MATLLNSAIVIGPWTLLAGVLIGALCTVVGLVRRGEGRFSALLRYLLIAFGIGIGAFWLGSAVGFGIFCLSGRGGNLCGLGGIFGFGPAFAGVALAAWGCRWALYTEESR